MTDEITADFLFFTDMEELSQAAASLFVELALQAVETRGQFTVALSGGSTPKRMFELLAAPPFREAVPWEQVIVFWGDDRAVPPDHDYSNYKLAYDNLLGLVPVVDKNIYRVQGELGADEATAIMRNDLADVFGIAKLPRFDLVLQGMGTDGHTASLFPGTDSLEATDWVVPVHDPPATPKVDRVTLSFPVLNNARTALFLAAGSSKQTIIAEIMSDPSAGERYPAARVEAESTLWYIDHSALGMG